jgi:2-C-methyl-D-erythritol 2,4-cyclodiphosphate synthase
MPLRIGLGHDTHRTAAGGPLILGGIQIECDFHLVGHSDADVLLHAITDALLSAAGLPDIGELFPDNAAENRGRDSGEMLRLAWAKVREIGWNLVNLDCVVLAQRPKLSPHKTQIRLRIADLLQISPEQIGLKGKTGESVGEIGRGETLQSIVIALLERS